MQLEYSSPKSLFTLLIKIPKYKFNISFDHVFNIFL